MAKYVLGEGAARKLRGILNGEMSAVRVDGRGAAVSEDADYRLPFAVGWAASADSGAGAWIIWLPGGELVVKDGTAVDVRTSLEAVGGDYPAGFYALAEIPAAGGNVYLNLVEKDGSTRAAFTSSAYEPEDGETNFPILVATASRTDGAAKVRQFVTSAVIVGGDAAVDGASVDKLNDIELAHFADTERDSTLGLAPRLKVNLETGEIYATGSDTLMLVCRKNGEVIYVPLSGNGSDPTPEGQQTDPCDHPGGGSGSAGGVPANEDDGGPGGVGDTGGGAGGVPANEEGEIQTGGVSADGEAHAGDPCTSEDCK